MKLQHKLILIFSIILAFCVILAPWLSGIWLERNIEAYINGLNQQQGYLRLVTAHYERGWIYSSAYVHVYLNERQFKQLESHKLLASSKITMSHGPLIDYHSFSSNDRWHWGIGMFRGYIDIRSPWRVPKFVEWEGIVPFYNSIELAFRQTGKDKQQQSGFYLDKLRGSVDYRPHWIIDDLHFSAASMGARQSDISWRMRDLSLYYKLTRQQWRPHWISWHGGRINEINMKVNDKQGLGIKNLNWLGRHWQINNRLDLEQQWQISGLRFDNKSIDKLVMSLEMANLKGNHLQQLLELMLNNGVNGGHKSIGDQISNVLKGAEFNLEGWFLANKAYFSIHMLFPLKLKQTGKSSKPWWQDFLENGRFSCNVELPARWVEKQLSDSNMVLPDVVKAPPKRPETIPAFLGADNVSGWLHWAIINHYLVKDNARYVTSLQFDGHNWRVRGIPLSRH